MFRMRLNFKIIALLLLSVLLIACGEWTYSPINTNVVVLKNSNGDEVSDCDGSSIPLRGGGAERFWKRNNLPKGTTDFVCKNGKAYLPNQVPRN